MLVIWGHQSPRGVLFAFPTQGLTTVLESLPSWKPLGLMGRSLGECCLEVTLRKKTHCGSSPPTPKIFTL